MGWHSLELQAKRCDAKLLGDRRERWKFVDLERVVNRCCRETVRTAITGSVSARLGWAGVAGGCFRPLERTNRGTSQVADGQTV